MGDALEIVLVACLGSHLWHLHEIRKLLVACCVELSTARWERGRLLRAQQDSQPLPPVRRQAEDAVI